VTDPAGAQSGTGTVTLIINTPEPHRFELALDEIELDWTERDPNRVLSPAPTAIANTRVALAERTRAVVALTAVGNTATLAARRAALEASNPGAEAHLVLYELGQRTASTRHLLTTRAALILEDPSDPTGALTEYAARNPRPVDGVPGAYTLEATDPLNTLDLAVALRRRAGVRIAYPLLERQQTPR
jgi:hypothetical protein